MRTVNIYYPFLIRLLAFFVGVPLFFIPGFSVFVAPEAAQAQGFFFQETHIPDISVTIADRYDPKSLPVNIAKPDNHPLPFDENGMRAIVTSLAYVEGKGGRDLGQPRAVFSISVADRLAPVLWRAFRKLRREEVIFFRVWGGVARTTGMVFMAGTKMYWRFGLIDGMPHENLFLVGLEEKDRNLQSIRYWRPTPEEKDATGPASRYIVTDVQAPEQEVRPDAVSPPKRVAYLISTKKPEEASPVRYKQIYGKVWWKKRGGGEEGEIREKTSMEPRRALENENEGIASTIPATIGMEIRQAPPPSHPVRGEMVASTSAEPKNKELDQGPPLRKAFKAREGQEGRRNVLLARYQEIKKMHQEGALTLEEYQSRRQALIRGEKVEEAPERVEVAAVTLAGEFSQSYEAPKDEIYREHPDHLEGFNRAMFKFNDFFYENLLKPVSTVYSEVTDEDFRSIVANFFRNLAMPVRLVSCLIQGEGEKAGRTFTRFVINTALTGGMVDVARTEFGIEEVDENFDQALGRHGVGTGSYVVWPVAGPSTVRGTFGMVADTLLKPFWFLGIGTVNFTALGSGERVNETALNLGFKEDIDEMAIDPYVSVRDLYFQHTQGKLKE